MAILFQPACFSSSGSEHFNIRKIQSQLSQRCSFHPSQVVFVFFPPSHPLFFEDSDVLIKYHFIDVKSLHSFLQYSYPVILMKILTEFLVHHYSFFFFSGRFNSSFGIELTPFLFAQCLFMPVHLLIFPACYSFVPEC